MAVLSNKRKIFQGSSGTPLPLTHYDRLTNMSHHILDYQKGGKKNDVQTGSQRCAISSTMDVVGDG